MLSLTPLDAKLFYFMATLNQLQNMGYINVYVEMFAGSDVIFQKMVSAGKVKLVEADLEEVLNITTFDKKDHDKLKKFYTFYHSFGWVPESVKNRVKIPNIERIDSGIN